MKPVTHLILLALAVAAQAQTDRHVIVVSLDGFPAYALNDPAIPLPVLRRLMREGGSAEGLQPVNPTVTWPNHTTIVTGVDTSKHGVLYNGMLVRGGEGKPPRVEPWVDQREMVQAPTIYDAAHDAGMTTAEVDWVAIYHAPTITWSFPEAATADAPVAREMLDAGIVTAAEMQAFAKADIIFKDEIWTRAALHILEKHRPNLLLFHLLTTDSSQHQYGAHTLGANTALILADRQLQRILDAIDRAGIRDRTTLIVLSDHGFKTYRHLIRPNALLRQKQLLREVDGKVECDVCVVPEGGTAMVYVTRESARAAGLKLFGDAVGVLPGLAKVILPAEYPQYGYPAVTPQGRMADMVLVPEPGYAFDATATGEPSVDVAAGATPGQHGYLNTDPEMTAILVAWGAGIQPGAHVGVVPNLGVAPTIARLLDLRFPGSPVVELLRK